MMIRPRHQAADVFTSLFAWKRQIRLPVFALTACTP
jgi:hypothetical protein